jgi:aromatase
MCGRTDNSIWIDADIDTVWTMTNDFEAWPEFFPDYAPVEILERRDNTFTYRLTTRPDENGRASSWISERTLDPVNHRVRAHRVETGLFEYLHLEWIYVPERSGTRMRWIHDFLVRPTAPVDDEHMANRINVDSRREMATIREKIERAVVRVDGRACFPTVAPSAPAVRNVGRLATVRRLRPFTQFLMR